MTVICPKPSYKTWIRVEQKVQHPEGWGGGTLPYKKDGALVGNFESNP